MVIKCVTFENKVKRICKTATQLHNNDAVSSLQVVAFFMETVFTDVLSQLHPSHPLLHPTPLLPRADPRHGQILQQGMCLSALVSLSFYVCLLWKYT